MKATKPKTAYERYKEKMNKQIAAKLDQLRKEGML